uniref:Uncharacterized protein n=1 Tax=Caenorhabditis japonica TaxID=281687 RepID=A0A8R1DEH1_CAEJA
MMIVTPMGHKRLRGRPPRQTAPVIHSQQIDAEADEKAAEEYLFQGGPAREETISSLEEQEKTSAPPPQPPAKVVRLRQTPKRRNEFSSAQEKAKHLKLDSSANEESIEPLIPNEAHIEEEASASAPGEAETEAEPQPQPDRAKKSIEAVVRREAQAVRDPKYAVYERPEEENSRCPPPAPRHLLNRANSRGRPANMVPPHRRPLPKDIVPPGPSKRAPVGIPKRKDHVEPSADNDSAPSSSSLNLNLNANSNSNSNSNSHDTIKAEPPPEAVREVVIEENESDSVNANANNGGDDDDTLPPPIPPSVQQQIQQQHQQQHQHTPTPSAPPSNPIPIKREREAGKDLPSEHFPKERARPVSTRGLYPKSPLMQFEVANQMLMHHDEDGGGGAQQRVLTLQGGSFIEDRIGRVELMEDEEMKMMKSIQQQQYIQVEEDGVNVMYEVDPNDVIETEEQEVQEDAYVMERPMQLQTKMEMVDEEEEVVDDDDDDELPPQLVAEGIPEEIPEDRQQTMHNKEMMEEENPFDLNMMEDGEMIRLNSPNGRAHEVRLARDIHGNPVFIDENGQIVELVTDTGALVEPSNMMEQQQEEMVEQEHGDKKKMGQQQQGNGEGPSGQMQTLHSERPNLEFSFLDSNNICCGLCGEIVVYEKLVSEHLPNAHPEFLSPGVELEEIPYDNWLKTRLKQEMKSMQNGFRHYDDHEGAGFGGTVRLYSKGLRQLRKVSQIRVNVNEMTLAQLENALRRKLLEKMNRRLPVSLVDRLHARCDICQAVVSLNKKFEVVHLVRHFNAWHPAEHRCSQEWKEGQEVAPSQSTRRPLSLHDFAVVRTDMDQNNLQCIWCGMFMDRAALGMHFTEVHTSQVVVPNCSLCLQEMVMTARLMEKYGEDFGISLPDEFHLHSSKLDARFNSEKALDKAIDKHLKRAKTGNDNDEDDGHEDSEAICTTNSQQSFGRRNRLKRKFVKPCFRQICPTNSQFFEAKSACEWICRLCNRAVYGAVISAGAIKHYKEFHPAEIDNMQYELVKARLERIGDGSMEFVHPQLVECLICNLTYALHKPFNICRAIRHLRLKHPETRDSVGTRRNRQHPMLHLNFKMKIRFQVRYMTEEEIQEAQARGEYLEFAEEYVEEVYQEQQ